MFFLHSKISMTTINVCKTMQVSFKTFLFIEPDVKYAVICS